MHIAKQDVPVKLEAPGAVARQQTGFGTAEGYGSMAGEFFSLAEGTDIAPLLAGLEDDACQAPHWGHVLAGEILVTYTDGTEERCVEGDLFHWPPGHSVRVLQDADVVLFSPEVEHGRVLDHMGEALKGMGA